MPTEKTEAEIDYDRLVDSLLKNQDFPGRAAMLSSGPEWVGHLLEALAPLRALSPGYGELPTREAEKFAQIQDALSRADLSKAANTGGLRIIVGKPAKRR